MEARGGRKKVQGGGRTEVRVGRMVVRAGGRSGVRVGRISPQDGSLWAPGGREVVQDAGGGRRLVLDGKEWVLDDRGLVLDGKQGLAHCILGGRSAARPRTQLWPGNRRRLLCRSRSAEIDMMGLPVLMSRMVTMIQDDIGNRISSIVFDDVRDSFLIIATLRDDPLPDSLIQWFL